MGRFLPMHVIKQYPPVVWVGLLGGAIIELTAGMIAPFLVLYLHDKLGGSVAMTMIVIGLQPFSEMILSIISGEVTDRFGRKRILVIALILQAAAMLGMSFAESVAAFALLYIVNGAGRSLYIPAERAIVADTVPPERQAEVFALFSTAGSVGAAIGPLLGLWIYRADPAFAFVCSALLLTMYAVAIRWKLQESLPTVAACDTISHHTQPLTMVSLRPIITMMLLTLPISLFYA
ncbi:MFS transporter [Brevibacillus humidisoli]|uniref:MFS transporter n=1 Tax=Brevibacillus humidisoli TaxID=2895522 RepID=UPI001E41ECA3|nr:MFS transporter [Brevibacillus humidisoli]UFJ42492.1 MFS transporter [Brevibacillus humidisoli]